MNLPIILSSFSHDDALCCVVLFVFSSHFFYGKWFISPFVLTLPHQHNTNNGWGRASGVVLIGSAHPGGEYWYVPSRAIEVVS